MKKLLLTIAVLFAVYASEAQVTKYINFGGIVRECLIHLPTGYNASRNYPLVFNLHGYGSNDFEEEIYTYMDSISNAEGFIVAYPNGVANQWNSGFVGTYGTGRDDVGFISALIDSINADYPVDLNRVYSCGMSNGGYQSHRLACELENRIAAIASVTGLLTDSTAFYCTTSRTVPIMQVHGTSDPTVNYNGFPGSLGVEATLSAWQTRNGCVGSIDTVHIANTVISDSTTADWITYHGCNGGTEMWFFKVYRGGHTWPHASIDNPPFGFTNRDFHASYMIWQFFKNWTLAGPASVNTNAQNENAHIELVPNPSNDHVSISSSKAFNSVALLDVSGRMMKSEFFENPVDQTFLHTEELPAGVYIIKLSNREGSEMRKIIIAH